MLELGVQEGSSQTALTEALPCSVAESLLHVGDVVEWRKDTPCTCFQVVESCLRDMRVTQVFDSRHLLPRPFGVKCGLQTPEFCQSTVKAALGAAVH